MFYREDQNEFIEQVKQPDCKLTDVLKDSRLNYSIRFEVPEVIQFLFDHLDELIETSINEGENSPTARSVLFDLSDQFSLNMSESSVFHNKMNHILGSEKVTKTSIIVLSRIIHSLGKSENYNIMSNLSENQFFFPKFCQNIQFNSVFETLMNLASNEHHSISAFFEDLNAAAVLFDLLEKSPPFCQDKYFLLLSEIIQHTDNESTLIASLADEIHASKIYNFATKSESQKVRFGAFSLLNTLCSKKKPSNDSYSSENDEQSIIFNNAIMEYALTMFEDLCNYVSKMPVFNSASEKAVNLLVVLIKAKNFKEYPPFLIDCANRLLDNFFSNPVQTKLHSCCMNLLFTICNSPAIVKVINLKSRILGAWLKTNHDNKTNFWGFIFKLAEIVLDLGDGDSDDEGTDHQSDNEDESDWGKFIQDYTLYKQIINNGYGGDLPADSFENFDTIDDEMQVIEDDKIDDEFQVVCIEDEPNDNDDIIPGYYQGDFKDDLNQLELDLKNDEEFENFIISRPKNDPSSPWAKDILDDLDDDFFIPKKEQNDGDSNWANQMLKELQEDDLISKSNSYDNIENESNENDNSNNNDNNNSNEQNSGNQNESNDGSSNNDQD